MASAAVVAHVDTLRTKARYVNPSHADCAALADLMKARLCEARGECVCALGAALIDGCTRFSSLWRIVVPLSVPGLVASSIFTFNGVWNEYIFALILAQDESRRMLSVGLSQFYRTDYYMVGPMMAGSLIAMTPVVLLYIVSQRYVVSGLAAGAVKG